MKPTRGLPKPWLIHVRREKRPTLFALAVLVLLLCSLVVYQKYFPSNRAPGELHVAGRSSAVEPAKAGESPDSSVDGAAGQQPVAAIAPTHLERPLGQKEYREVTKYGFGLSAIYGDWRLYPGVDYAANPGELVVAAAGGKVNVERDPFMGPVISINHGGGLVTQYVGVKALQVSSGQIVSTGQPLGQVSDQAPIKSIREPYLHFEVRLNDEPVDPGTYFAQ
ncbi:MAG: peptidoglycan DD-metalloendopeptidase family protein [Mycobacterium leprae]